MPPSTDLRPTDVVRRLSPAELRAIADLTDYDDFRAGAAEIRAIAEELALGGAVTVKRPAYRMVFLPGA